MAQVRLARKAQADLERLFEFLASKEPSAAAASFRAILDAISVLRQHPLIGRHIGDDLRELVISRGKSGYVALYRYLPARDSVRVLAIKHQREAGFTEH